MTKKSNSLAQKGSGFFKCLDCGKKTRATGTDASSVEMCDKCYDAALEANRTSDEGSSPTELISTVGKRKYLGPSAFLRIKAKTTQRKWEHNKGSIWADLVAMRYLRMFGSLEWAGQTRLNGEPK